MTARIEQIDARIERLRLKRDAARAAHTACTPATSQKTYDAWRAIATQLAKAVRERGNLRAKFKAKGDDMKKSLLLEEETATANASHDRDGLVPVADKRIDAGGWIFNRGCRLPSLELLAGPAYYANMKKIRWDLPSTVNEKIRPIRMIATSPTDKPTVIHDPRTGGPVERYEAIIADLLAQGLPNREAARVRLESSGAAGRNLIIDRDRIVSTQHAIENNLNARRIAPAA